MRTSKIGLVVDGQGDFKSLRTRFSDGFKILKTDGPRGHHATVIEIAARSKKQLEMLKLLGYSSVVLVLDFEMRTEGYEQFVNKLAKAFSSKDFGVQVRVAVPNRMFENWLLADIEHLSKNKAFLKDGLRQKNYEGSAGKDELKRCMRPGHSYAETIHGPQLFKILRFDVARENSVSLQRFLDGLFECGHKV